MHAKHQQSAQFMSLDEIIDQIKDGSILGLGGFWFVRIPTGLVDALVQRGVRNLTVITQVSGLALEQLISAGLVKKVIFSFASLDVFGLPPYFRKAVEEDRIEWEEWTALRMNQALEAGRQGLPSFVMQPPYGSAFTEETSEFKHMICPITGKEVGMMKAMQPDVSFIHAQKADESGNIQLQGALGIDRLLIGASKQAFVSVEEIVQKGQFDPDFRSTIIPRFLINGICHMPGGAYPSSCLPYYITDYWQLSYVIKHAKNDGYDSLRKPQNESLEQRIQGLNEFTTIDAFRLKEKLPLKSVSRAGDYTIEELMVCVMASEMKNDMVSTVGSNTPLSMAAYLLAKKTHAPDVVLIPYTGLNDIPAYPITLSLSEVFAYHHSSSHWSIEDLWQWIYQKSLTAVEFGSPAQIDEAGRINLSLIGTKQNIKVRLPGQAGLADVLNLHHNCLLYITRQDKRRMVSEVDFASGGRAVLSDVERREAGLPAGKYKLFTNLGIFELDHNTKKFKLVSIHPGVSLQEVQENTGFPIMVSDDLTVTSAPTPEQIEILRYEIDPFGFRKLELSNASDRIKLIADILRQEQTLLFGEQRYEFEV